MKNTMKVAGLAIASLFAAAACTDDYEDLDAEITCEKIAPNSYQVIDPAQPGAPLYTLTNGVTAPGGDYIYGEAVNVYGQNDGTMTVILNDQVCVIKKKDNGEEQDSLKSAPLHQQSFRLITPAP